MSFISKPLREKMCLFMAPSTTSVALIRIQTPSFSICHGPNIDLVCDKDLRSMKKSWKARILMLCLNSASLVLDSVLHSLQEQQYWVQWESYMCGSLRSPGLNTERCSSEQGTLEIQRKKCFWKVNSCLVVLLVFVEWWKIKLVFNKEKEHNARQNKYQSK